jgi:two-component system NtrC family sensor kinase
MIEAFVWSDRFATGIESVDGQHRQLVDIVNQVGDRMVSGEALDEGEAQALFKRLADYARFHFADEERVMIAGGLDPRHVELHRQHHRSFTEQVVTMWQARASMEHPAENLHGFLSAWLTYHILGEDQAMAREIIRVREGMAPAAAHEIEANRGERSTSALLQAMQRLYGVLSQQNRDLAAANLALEDRVAARTAELDAAYARLAADNLELTGLLARVEQAQSQLLQSEKMASIGQLAAGVAHEINNPIGFVNSNLGTLGRYVGDLLRLADAAGDSPGARAVAGEVDLPFLREDLKALLGESRDGLERVRRIVANLKDSSHVDQAAEFVLADLVAGLESTIGVAAHELKYKIELVRKLQPLPLVRCIPAQINQVFLNLLVNAAQAIQEHGVITLGSGLENDQVWIEISDTGSGMDEATRKRIFDPFFTTKPVGKGTGLGLSICYDIVRSHGGSFDVASAVGAGTSVRLWLPVAGPPEAVPR